MGFRLPCALVASFLVVAASPLAAQLPFPLPGQPSQDAVLAKPDCSAKGVKSLEGQVADAEALERTAPETIKLVCGGLEAVSGFMQWKDDEPIPGVLNDLAREILHRDVTPRMLKAMCRQVEGEAGRGLRTEIGRLKDQLTGCRGI